MSDKNDSMKDSENENQDVLNFAVMPQDAGGELVSSEGPLQGIPSAEPEEDQQNLPTEDTPAKSGKGIYIFLSVVILAALGGLAYYLLWSTPGNSSNGLEESKLPKVFLMQYFGVEQCSDQDTCGDKADPDNDGLNNYDEFVEQTDPKVNDTDGDGLADGDEVKIYLTNPTKKYTDPRKEAEQAGYHDGSQIANEYDPLTPGFKMTEVRKSQISANKQTHGLHEPTITTISKVGPQVKTVQVSIMNSKFDPAEVTVNAGDTVVWTNKEVNSHQIASDPHPTHILLPDLESGILATNQTYSFKFTEKGTFTYHDHLNPAITGTIIVQ